jgi:hypothetical protein
MAKKRRFDRSAPNRFGTRLGKNPIDTGVAVALDNTRISSKKFGGMFATPVRCVVEKNKIVPDVCVDVPTLDAFGVVFVEHRNASVVLLNAKRRQNLLLDLLSHRGQMKRGFNEQVQRPGLPGNAAR